MPRPKNTSPTCKNNHARIPENMEIHERCRLCTHLRVRAFRARRKADSAVNAH
jgi:hypothetical protein